MSGGWRTFSGVLGLGPPPPPPRRLPTTESCPFPTAQESGALPQLSCLSCLIPPHPRSSSSVLNCPGARWGPAWGLPSVQGGTGRLSVTCLSRPKGRTGVFVRDGVPYRVRYVSSGQGVDGGGRRGTAGDGMSDVLRCENDSFAGV